MYKHESTISLTYCDEKHFLRATEFHINGELCGFWLKDIERGHLSVEQKEVVKVMVMEDSLRLNLRLDKGQLLRLQTSLSLASDPGMKRHWWKFWVKEPSTGVELGFESMKEMQDSNDAQTPAGQKGDG